MKKIYTLCSIIISAQFYCQVNLNSSLTACYALNGNGTEPVNNLTGVLSAVTPTVDRFNNLNSAMYFSGTVGSMIKLPSSPLLKPSNDVSFSVWIKPDMITTMELIYTKNIWSSYFSAYALTFQPAAWPNTGYVFRGYRQNGSGDNTVESTTSISSPGNWYHVVLTISNSQMQMYVNGVLEDTTPCTITNFNYQSGKEVILSGTNESAVNPPFKGSMDNLRFYDRVINAAEVSALYNQDPACIGGSVPDPVMSVSSTTICERDTVFLNDASSNNPTSWSWTMPGGSPPSAAISNPYVVYNVPGIYTITLVASNQFGPSNPVYQIITVIYCDSNPQGIKTNAYTGKIKVSPNPCTDKLTIKFAQTTSGEWTMLDVLGRKVKQGRIRDNLNMEIDMSEETQGLYFLNMSVNGQQSVTKIIKE